MNYNFYSVLNGHLYDHDPCILLSHFLDGNYSKNQSAAQSYVYFT